MEDQNQSAGNQGIVLPLSLQNVGVGSQTAANPPPSPAAQPTVVPIPPTTTIPNLAPRPSAPAAVAQKQIAKEFRHFECSKATLENINFIRFRFDELLGDIAARMPPETQNARYLAIVKTKLEEACMMAIKGFSSH